MAFFVIWDTAATAKFVLISDVACYQSGAAGQAACIVGAVPASVDWDVLFYL